MSSAAKKKERCDEYLRKKTQSVKVMLDCYAIEP